MKFQEQATVNFKAVFSIWSRGGDREMDLKDRNSADKKCLLNKYGPKYKSFVQT